MGRDDAASERDQRLGEVLGAYFVAIKEGRDPGRVELLSQHPDLANDLDEYFTEQDRLDRLTAPLREIADPRHALIPSIDGDATVNDRPESGAPGWTRGESGGPVTSTRVRYFGDYELLEEIARGGMGVVYRARQVSLNRLVALKMILAGRLASEDDVKRFRNEAEAVANLDHPNIVPIYEVGEHDGCSYLAMKLIAGGSLAGKLSDYANDTRSAAGLVATTARAVHHAHQRGVLHRDLKPSNILLDGAGQPHVTDFGLAKRIEGGADLTQSGAILGSLPYMAAEQASGKRGKVTTATDVYGLGAVLYATLTGRPPFQADSVLETIEQVREREPEPPSGINRRVDRDLQTVCVKCLCKDPQRRYGSALELAEDLERWLRGEPVAAAPPSAWYRFRKFARRNRVALAAVSAVVLGLIVAVTALAVSTVVIARGRAEALRKLAEVRGERRELVAAYFQAYEKIGDMMKAMHDGTFDAKAWGEQNRTNNEIAISLQENLARQLASDPEGRFDAARCYYQTAIEQDNLHRGTPAQVNQQQAVSILNELLAESPDRVEYLEALRFALSHQGVILMDAGRRAEAAVCLRRAVALGVCPSIAFGR